MALLVEAALQRRRMAHHPYAWFFLSFIFFKKKGLFRRTLA
jgi:hypothetical protein